MFFSFVLFAGESKTWKIENINDFDDGSFCGLSLNSEKGVFLSPKISKFNGRVSYKTVASLVNKKGEVFTTTAFPGAIWRASENGEFKKIYQVKEAFVTGLVLLPGGAVAALSAPNGGIHILDPVNNGEPKYIPVSEVTMLLSGFYFNGKLYVVGGGNRGVLLTLKDGDTRVSRIFSVNENYLRSVFVFSSKNERKPVVFTGGGESGIIYKWADGKLASVFQSRASEVVSIFKDKYDGIIASIISTNGKLSEPIDSSIFKSNSLKESGKNFSSEILRISETETTKILWQSRGELVSSLFINKNADKLFFGTSPGGFLFSLNLVNPCDFCVLKKLKNCENFISISPCDSADTLICTTNTGVIYKIKLLLKEEIGEYVTDIIDVKNIAEAESVFINSEALKNNYLDAFIRVGNSNSINNTWSDFLKATKDGVFSGIPYGRYFQLKLVLRNSSAQNNFFIKNIWFLYRQPVERENNLQ